MIVDGISLFSFPKDKSTAIRSIKLLALLQLAVRSISKCNLLQMQFLWPGNDGEWGRIDEDTFFLLKAH